MKETRLILLVMVVLVCIEATVRYSEQSLSGNINHIKSIPSIAGSITSKAPSVVFLGNSLTNNGINVDVFEAEYLNKSGQKINAYKITPDATALWDWHCIYKHNFDQSNSPDILVIGFAWGQLQDQSGPNPSRIAGFFCKLTDIDDLITFGMNRVSDVLEYIVANVSQVYVNRGAIRNRLLDYVIYDFRESTQYINALTRETKRKDDRESINRSYKLLESLSELAASRGSKLFVMSMPVVNKYDIDQSLLESLTQNSVTFRDFRRLEFIKPESFIDPIHLGGEGTSLFSKYIASTLIEVYSPKYPQNKQK